ncbi:MAG TPA: ABC transporter substrate-binding protein [Stellaceae bacterium]|jgi:NitT/TauT family transport system substrate-binding protein|nr:ABC transporter substrate-binding protein [Stellaceae bacterium]
MRLSRRAFRPAAALAALGIAACVGTPTEAGEPIRVGIVSTSLASIPLVVADAKGFFRDEGFDVTIVPFESAQPIVVAIAAGDVDFGSAGLTDAFFVLANQGSMKVIGGDTVEHAGFHGLGFIVSNQAYAAGLTSLDGFAGHSVGITQLGSPLQYSLALMLEKHHIDLSKVRVLGLQSNGNVASALTGGQIDASIMSSANLNAILARGGGKFLAWLDDEVHGASVTGTVTSTKIANERPDTVKRFLAAFRKAAKTWDAGFVDTQGNRADQPSAPELIALMAKGLNQKPEVILQGMNYVEPEARINISDVQHMLNWYEAQGMQKTHIDAKNIIDMRYARLTDQSSE